MTKLYQKKIFILLGLTIGFFSSCNCHRNPSKDSHPTKRGPVTLKNAMNETVAPEKTTIASPSPASSSPVEEASSPKNLPDKEDTPINSSTAETIEDEDSRFAATLKRIDDRIEKEIELRLKAEAIVAEIKAQLAAIENMKNNIRLWTQEIDQKLPELLQNNQIPTRFRKRMEQLIQDKEREKQEGSSVTDTYMEIFGLVQDIQEQTDNLQDNELIKFITYKASSIRLTERALREINKEGKDNREIEEVIINDELVREDQRALKMQKFIKRWVEADNDGPVKLAKMLLSCRKIPIERVIINTGLTREEVEKLAMEELDGDLWVFPPYKNRESQGFLTPSLTEDGRFQVFKPGEI